MKQLLKLLHHQKLSIFSFTSSVSTKTLINTQHVLTRHPFKTLTSEDLSFFRSILAESQIIEQKSELESYNTCWRDKNHGKSLLALLPKTTQQISKILKYCNSENLAVNPQGGNTGLVGGSVPVFDQIILSLKLMNKIQSYDRISSVLSCQAGCILQKLNEYLQKEGTEIPLDLGAKGSCMIGGNAATNAGGKYVVKHGPFRAHILGMQAVMANGTILDMRSQVIKDNTGYDLKDLFIGSEGTLGIITKLDINCVRVDKNKRILLLKADCYEKVLEAVPIIKDYLGKSLNALQYMDGWSYLAMVKHLYPSILNEPVSNSQHLLFIQLSCPPSSSEQAAISFIQSLFQSLPAFSDSLISSSQKQYKNIWRYRQECANAAKKQGIVHSYDLSFQIKLWPDLLQTLRKRYNKKGTLILGYGHIGDGNLHVNVCVKREAQDEEVIDEKEIFEYVISKGGSMSAEHGLGIHKPQFLRLQKKLQVVKLFQGIKNLFDPKAILNPYKVLPE